MSRYRIVNSFTVFIIAQNVMRVNGPRLCIICRILVNGKSISASVLASGCLICVGKSSTQLTRYETKLTNEIIVYSYRFFNVWMLKSIWHALYDGRGHGINPSLGKQNNLGRRFFVYCKGFVWLLNAIVTFGVVRKLHF